MLTRFFIFIYAQNTTDYDLSGGAILLGCLIGIFLPILSNILPIQKALSKNLRVSLDLYHRSVNELTVSIKRLEEMGLSVNQMIVAIMLIVLGAITYYVAPMAFVYQNYSLFFFILNFILILMILGLAFISILLLPFVETLYVKLFLCLMRKDRKLYKVVSKNLEGHMSRNTKTAMMFTVALSFLIFAGSTFDLIGHLIVSQLESTIGSDLYASTTPSPSYLDEGTLIGFLEEQKKIDGAVISYAFASNELSALSNRIAPTSNYRTRFYFGSSSGYNQVKVRVYSVDENYLRVVNSEYYMPREVQKGLTLGKLSNGD